MVDINVFHNSQNLKYRKPFGAIKVGEKVYIAIDLNIEANVYLHLIEFCGKKSRIQMLKNKSLDNNIRFDICLDTNNLYGILNYYFEIVYENKTIYYGNNEECLGGIGKCYDSFPKLYQITIYKDRKVPKWYKEGIIYQIFVDRFFNGNDDFKINNPKKNSFIYGSWDDDPMYIKDNKGNIIRWDFYGGNLKGIIKKLPYIKSLGVSIIYMNPIFKSASCHKYDTGDYEKIDEMFGTEEDFQELCSEAKKLNINIILDGVFSHTGSDSKYFNKFNNYDSIGAYQSKESIYYNWYRFYEYPDKYESWWGFENQPNVNELNKDYINYIVKDKNSIISKWMKLGAIGWRLDVADELPDEFIKLIKDEIISNNKESVLIGEVWEDASNKISYSERRRYFFGDELDSVTNYPLRDVLIRFLKKEIDKNYFIKKIMSIYENYPRENFYSNMNLLGNHDTERILTLLENNKKLLELAIAIQMTLPGVPLIYYGDEVGLTGGRDPQNRKPYPWGRENKEILDLYKKLTTIRNKEDSLKKGDFNFIYDSEELLIYERIYENEKIIVIVNPYNKKINYELKNKYKVVINLIDKENGIVNENGNVGLRLNELDYKILKIKL